MKQLAKPILGALILGALFGLFLNKYSSYVHPSAIDLTVGILDVGGQWFLRAIQFIVVPLVFCSLACSIARVGIEGHLSRIFSKTIFIYILTTAFAITSSIFLAQLFSVGEGTGEMSSAGQLVITTAGDFSPLKFFTELMPSNLIDVMANSKMLPLILAAIAIGYAVVRSESPHRETILDFLTALEVVVTRLLTMILYWAPVGIFCLLAALFYREGLAILMDLAKYGLVMILALFIHIMILAFILIKLISGLPIRQFFINAKEVMLFSFSTSSSSATLPLTMKTAEGKIGIDKGVSSLTLPLGATVNMDGGGILLGLAVVFIANAYGIQLSFLDYGIIILTATLGTVGTAGIPGAGIVTLSLVLMQAGLPIEGIALIVGVDRLLEMFRTMTNVLGDLMVATVVAKTEDKLDKNLFEKTGA